MKVNRKIFFDHFRAWRSSLTQQQVTGLTFLLDCIEGDRFIERVSWASYLLATIMHETAFTFMPIHEYGGHNYFVNRYGGQTRKGKELGNDTPEEGYDYAGKGYAQTTGEANYEKSEIALRREYPALVADFERRTGKRFDLTVGDQEGDKADAQNMLDPKIAYAVMSYGMRSGMFTGRKLSQYLNNTIKDYVNARKIINGEDKANTIAGYAKSFETILNLAIVKDSPLSITVQEQGQIEKDLDGALQPVVLSHPTLDTLKQEKQPETPPNAENPPLQTDPNPSNSTDSSKASVLIDGNKIDVKTESDSNKPPDKVAVVKPPNLFQYMWQEITGLFGGNLSLDAATEKAGQIQALGLPYSFWSRVIYFAIAATLIYFIVKLVRAHQANKKTEYLVKANTTENNTVILVDEKDVADRIKEGYKIITR